MSYIANYSGILTLFAISCLTLVNGFEVTDCDCGISGNIKRRILGGREALLNEYPWIVAVLYENRHRCGGTLINQLYVLTAGHCVNGIEMPEITLAVQQHRRDSADGVRLNISEIIIHEKFKFNGKYHDFDIALIKLPGPVRFSTVLSPICLPSPESQDFKKPAIIVGWGELTDRGELAEVLQKTEVNILTRKQCARTAMRRYQADHLICAHSKGRDACGGDSGGPLMYEIEMGKWEIVGVIAWGRGCGARYIPGMYSKITYFLDWIYRNTEDATDCSGR